MIRAGTYAYSYDQGEKGQAIYSLMRIDSSSIGMESARSYTAASISYRRFEVTDFSERFTGLASGNQNTYSSLPDGEKEQENKGKVADRESIISLQEKMATVRANYFARTQESNTAEEIRMRSIMYILELLFGDAKERFKDLYEKYCQPSVGEGNGIGTVNTEGMSTDPSSIMNTPVAQISYKAVNSYYESEETSFSAQGLVKTADGREISFNIDVGMSREFSAYYEENLNLNFTQTCDPLVINLDGNVADVSDCKFYFDIDGDGEKDQINRLGQGSGYLALDINEDGEINDGNELFGTKSGNGFKDLAEYDQDGNGWIDENDQIFDKLRIWVMDEKGDSSLYKLSEAGVGAICLSKVGTDFAKTTNDNQAKAFVRSTGVFLYENGNVGTVQHLDMVKYAANA